MIRRIEDGRHATRVDHAESPEVPDFTALAA
jgi:hypothetical protein